MAHAVNVHSYSFDVPRNAIEQFAARNINVEQLSDELGAKGFRIVSFSNESIRLSKTFWDGQSEVTITFEEDM